MNRVNVNNNHKERGGIEHEKNTRTNTVDIGTCRYDSSNSQAQKEITNFRQH